MKDMEFVRLAVFARLEPNDYATDKRAFRCGCGHISLTPEDSIAHIESSEHCAHMLATEGAILLLSSLSQNAMQEVPL